jgi:hypothetical protein
MKQKNKIILYKFVNNLIKYFFIIKMMEIKLVKFKIILLSIIVSSLLLLSGCLEEKNENETNDKNIDENFNTLILGTWVGEEKFENFTYIIEYNFFSNNSFFSGLKDQGNDNFNVSIWGTYEINVEEIKLTVGGEESTHKYLIFPDKNKLLFYYEDGINFYELFKEL